MLKLANLHYNPRKNDYYAEIVDENDGLIVSATLKYILEYVVRHNVTVEGIRENFPLGRPS